MNKILGYCLDTANIDWIKEGMEMYPLRAFSMNPGIARRDLMGKDQSFFDALKEIRETIGENTEFHVQTIGPTAEEIIKDAEAIRAHVKGDNLYVKIDAYPEGYKAMKKLHAMGYKITATAIVTVNQALLSIEAGADCVAVYVGRADNISGDGIKVVEEIGKVMKMKGINNVILAAASMRTAHQVEQAALAGADNVAVSLDILKACASHPLTNSSVDAFVKDWETLYGEGKRIYNLE